MTGVIIHQTTTEYPLCANHCARSRTILETSWGPRTPGYLKTNTTSGAMKINKASEPPGFLCKIGTLNISHPILHIHTQAWHLCPQRPPASSSVEAHPLGEGSVLPSQALSLPPPSCPAQHQPASLFHSAHRHQHARSEFMNHSLLSPHLASPPEGLPTPRHITQTSSFHTKLAPDVPREPIAMSAFPSPLLGLRVLATTFQRQGRVTPPSRSLGVFIGDCRGSRDRGFI